MNVETIYLCLLTQIWQGSISWRKKSSHALEHLSSFSFFTTKENLNIVESGVKHHNHCQSLVFFVFHFITTEFIRIYSCYIFAIFHRKNKNFFMYLIWSYFGILSFTWTEAGFQSYLYLIGRDSAWCTLGCQDKTRVGWRTV
jgi:hypothetical protein